MYFFILGMSSESLLERKRYPGLGPPGPCVPSRGGVTFTRWGRTTCPPTKATQQIYNGTVAGSASNHAGSADYLCLHAQQQFLQITAGEQEWRGKLYTTEFAATADSEFGFHHDIPCSVCYSEIRNTLITIPGRISCPEGWINEYYGYLMGVDWHPERGSRSPICVDEDAESIPKSQQQPIKSLLYYFENICQGPDCSSNTNGGEVTCVVCSR